MPVRVPFLFACMAVPRIEWLIYKAKLDCLWIRDLPGMKIKGKMHANTTAGHKALLAWAVKQTGEDVTGLHFVMEATGVYHETLACALHDAGAHVSVVNPARVRDFAKSLGAQTKTDKKDSVVIARFGMTQSPRLWEPEPIEVRQLKALIARCDAVKQDIQRELNRMEKATVSDASAEVRVSIETVRSQLEAEKKRHCRAEFIRPTAIIAIGDKEVTMPCDALRKGRHSLHHQVCCITTVTRGHHPLFTDISAARLPG